MSRTTIIVLLALGATFAGFVLASNAQRLRDDEPAPATSSAAGPQSRELGWHETYGSGNERLVFDVDRLDVTETGWSAQIGVTNSSSVGWELAPGMIPDGTFGLQLFETSDPKELEDRNRDGTLPAVRAATRYDPELVPVLEPGSTWKGTIAARGSLAAGAWVRVVFGTLVAVGKPPKELSENVVWITDHSYRLKE
jgi:hypothetical protein